MDKIYEAYIAINEKTNRSFKVSIEIIGKSNKGTHGFLKVGEPNSNQLDTDHETSSKELNVLYKKLLDYCEKEVEKFNKSK